MWFRNNFKKKHFELEFLKLPITVHFGLKLPITVHFELNIWFTTSNNLKNYGVLFYCVFTNVMRE